jgi:hypothetical protein
MRNITFLVVGLAAGTFVGTVLNGSDLIASSAHSGHQMGSAPYDTLGDDRKNIWPADLPAPTIALDLQPDPASGHNLFVTLDGFEMTPEDVNKAVEPGTGHGHLFINGENVGRLYAPMRHLVNLPKGEVTIHMYLGGNDHKVWVVDGEPLFVEETFVIE